MDFLTVTCNRDFQLMILQAESIHRFISPSCTHWVIINEEDDDIERWKTALSPYYTSHTLKLLTLNDFKSININLNGWLRQQMLKLRIAEFLNDDYLILDTKFFFIKPTDLSFWENRIGDGKLYTLDKTSAYSCWQPASTTYANKLNVPELKDIFFTTPFKIKIKYLKNVDMDFLQECLYENHNLGPYYVSEFVLYSYLAKNEIKHNTGKILETYDVPLIRPNNVWATPSPHEGLYFVIKLATRAKIDDNIRIFGFHPHYIMAANNQHLAYINNFIKSLGLTTIITPELVDT